MVIKLSFNIKMLNQPKHTIKYDIAHAHNKIKQKKYERKDAKN